MATNADMSLKEFAKEMLVEVKKDQEWLTRQKEIMGDLQERIDECFKRVQKCDMTKGVYSTTQMAKELGMSSAQKLYEELKEVGLAFNQGYEWMLTSPYSTYQLTEVTTHIIKGKYTRRPLWTERGRRWLLALKEKNIICNLPKPRVPKAVEKCIASQSGEMKEEVKVEPPTPLMKKAETLKDEINCLLSLITEVGKGETILLMGDIMTISTTISEHVSTLAFEAYKTLNAPARA
jgi:hypothetical protein